MSACGRSPGSPHHTSLTPRCCALRTRPANRASLSQCSGTSTQMLGALLWSSKSASRLGVRAWSRQISRDAGQSSWRDSIRWVASTALLLSGSSQSRTPMRLRHWSHRASYPMVMLPRTELLMALADEVEQRELLHLRVRLQGGLVAGLLVLEVGNAFDHVEVFRA